MQPDSEPAAETAPDNVTTLVTTLPIAGSPAEAVVVDAAPAPTPAVAAPSPDIPHAQVFLNELKLRLSGFDQGITTMGARRDSVVARHNAAIAELEEKHAIEITEIDRLIDDLEQARDGALAGIEAMRNFKVNPEGNDGPASSST